MSRNVLVHDPGINSKIFNSEDSDSSVNSDWFASSNYDIKEDDEEIRSTGRAELNISGGKEQDPGAGKEKAPVQEMETEESFEGTEASSAVYGSQNQANNKSFVQVPIFFSQTSLGSQSSVAKGHLPISVSREKERCVGNDIPAEETQQSIGEEINVLGTERQSSERGDQCVGDDIPNNEAQKTTEMPISTAQENTVNSVLGDDQVQIGDEKTSEDDYQKQIGDEKTSEDDYQKQIGDEKASEDNNQEQIAAQEQIADFQASPVEAHENQNQIADLQVTSVECQLPTHVSISRTQKLMGVMGNATEVPLNLSAGPSAFFNSKIQEQINVSPMPTTVTHASSPPAPIPISPLNKEAPPPAPIPKSSLNKEATPIYPKNKASVPSRVAPPFRGLVPNPSDTICGHDPKSLHRLQNFHIDLSKYFEPSKFKKPLTVPDSASCSKTSLSKRSQPNSYRDIGKLIGFSWENDDQPQV